MKIGGANLDEYTCAFLIGGMCATCPNNHGGDEEEDDHGETVKAFH
jgi:hypothetical protein